MTKPRYKYLPLKLTLEVEPFAASRGVSDVARSQRGFMRAFEKAGSYGKLDDYWRNRRDNFVARHMAQVKKRGEPLWEADGAPTRRHLALVMWAYSPDPERLRRWLASAKLTVSGLVLDGFFDQFDSDGDRLIRVVYAPGETGWVELLGDGIARIDSHPITEGLEFDDIVELEPPAFPGDLPHVAQRRKTAGYRKPCYVYETDCVSACGEDISDMIDLAEKVKYEELAANVQGLDEWAEDHGYSLDPADGGLLLKDDWHVGYYRSTYRGQPCYYLDWSSIEHVWVLDPGC